MRKQNTIKLERRMSSLANKYYNTTDIDKLTPTQLDKVITWAMNWSPDKGKNKAKKYQKAITGGTKYLNSAAQTTNILDKTHKVS
jgi:hypothetical protein